MSSELAIVVMSCDRYADMWEPFIRCFEQYWPDCPYEKYLVTETSKCQNKFFTETFECGAGTEWTDRLDYIVTQLEQDCENPRSWKPSLVAYSRPRQSDT